MIILGNGEQGINCKRKDKTERKKTLGGCVNDPRDGRGLGHEGGGSMDRLSWLESALPCAWFRM